MRKSLSKKIKKINEPMIKIDLSFAERVFISSKNPTKKKIEYINIREINFLMSISSLNRI